MDFYDVIGSMVMGMLLLHTALTLTPMKDSSLNYSFPELDNLRYAFDHCRSRIPNNSLTP